MHYKCGANTHTHTETNSLRCVRVLCACVCVYVVRVSMYGCMCVFSFCSHASSLKKERGRTVGEGEEVVGSSSCGFLHFGQMKRRLDKRTHYSWRV